MIYIIQSIHLLIVVSCFISIFYNDIKFKRGVFGLLLLLLFKYITGIKRCGLTELEYIIKGKDYEEGFIYRIVNPIVTIPEEYFESYLFTMHIIWILILYYQLYL